MSSITDLIDKFKSISYGESKEEIEGYLIINDSMNNKSMLLVKDREKSWKTKWFNNNQMTYKVPSEPLQNIFINK